MEFLVISLTALLGSALTFFSGFGLGTVLLPVFALFFPVDIAIVLTAIVHFLNNIFKIFLIGNHVNKNALLLFGIPSFIAAIAGAYLLTSLSDFKPIFNYQLNDKEFHITVIKITIASLMILFAIMELRPSAFKIKNGKRQLITGGILSGFFGGLSGHQGALRSAFLLQLGLSKEAFVATGTAIAIIVDVARLSVYSLAFLFHSSQSNFGLIAVAVLFAFAGAYTGSKLLNKITVKFIQGLVAAMLIVFAILIGVGII
jgi:uncharacterized membrane protein YfcA